MIRLLLPFLLCLCMAVTGSFAQTQTDNPEYAGTSSFEEYYARIAWDCFVYPVPAVEKVNVKITKGDTEIRHIIITDEFGHDVMEIKDLQEQKMEINVSELPEGKYFMQLIPEDRQYAIMKRLYVSN